MGTIFTGPTSRGMLASLATLCSLGPAFSQPVAVSQSTAFVENRGQWDGQARFLARTPGVNSWLTDDGVVFDFNRIETVDTGLSDALFGKSPRKRVQNARRGHVVRMDFVGGRPAISYGLQPLDGVCNFILGNRPDKWVEGARRYAEAKVENIYPGISALWRFESGRPRYDLVVQPGADPGKIALRFRGSDGVTVNGSSLSIQTSVGTVQQKDLFAYQRIGNRVTQIPCSMFVDAAGLVRFRLGSYNPSISLVIDPLIWSTYLGGSAFESMGCVQMDSSGGVIAAGSTSSTDYPTTVGAYDRTPAGSDDIVVTKLSPSGSSLVYSTLLGGQSDDWLNGLWILPTGEAILSGGTRSTDYPTTLGAFDRVLKGEDAFVTQLTPNGAGLTFSTLLGGDGAEAGGQVVATSGGIYVAGDTLSTNFPTTSGAYDRTLDTSAHYDAFISKISLDGKALLASTYFGGTAFDSPLSLAVGAGGNVFIAGVTESRDMPVTAGAFQRAVTESPSVTAPGNAFLAKFSGGLTSLILGTFLGGERYDYCSAMWVDSTGAPTLVGFTYSTAFPTTPGAMRSTKEGTGSDAFITKLGAGGAALIYSTLFGGNRTDYVWGAAPDGLGAAIVVGDTNSSDLPLAPNGFDLTRSGSWDGFLARIKLDGTGVTYSSLLGGSSNEGSLEIGGQPGGPIVVAGTTDSTDFPTTLGAFETTSPSMGTASDFFVTKLWLPPFSNANAYFTDVTEGISISAPGVLGNDLYAKSAVLVRGPDHAISFGLKSDGAFYYTPAPTFTGDDTFTYRARNEGGDSVASTVTITVRARLASLTLDTSPLTGGAAITGEVSLTTPAAAGGVQVYFRDTHSRVLSEGVVATVPARAASVRFSIPTKSVASQISVQITASLNNGGGSDQTASVVLKPLPVAQPDEYSTPSNTRLRVRAPGVLANDRNVLDGRAVLISGPANAAGFSLGLDGAMNYTPKPSFAGQDTFTYKVKNAGGSSEPATVTITVGG